MTTTTTTAATSNDDDSQPQPSPQPPSINAQPRKHRSVKSLTKEYESQGEGADQSPSTSLPNAPPSPRTTTTTHLSPFPAAAAASPSSSSASPGLLSPDKVFQAATLPRSPSSESLRGPAPHHQRLRTFSSSSSLASNHSRNSSVLLASPSYPSTLNAHPASSSSSSSLHRATERQRTLSAASASSPRQLSPTSPTGSDSSLAARASSSGLPEFRAPEVIRGERVRKLSGTFESRPHLPTPDKATGTMSNAAARGEEGKAAKADRSASVPEWKVSHADHEEDRALEGEISKAAAAQVRVRGQGDDEEEEEEEDEDALGELQSGGGASPSTTTTTKPLSEMTPAERREHSRRHSRVHSRNLSVFFPRPGTEAEVEADREKAARAFLEQGQDISFGGSPATPSRAQPEIKLQTAYLSTPDAARGGASPKASPASLGGDGGSSPSLSPTTSQMTRTNSKDRRAHHRKHSVSHALFDGKSLAVARGAAEGAGEGPNTPHYHHSTPMTAHDDLPLSPARQSAALPFVSASQAPARASLVSTLPSALRPLLLFGLVHFALGAYVWVAGQANDSLAMAGLGYLVVFDAFGVLSDVGGKWAEENMLRAETRRIRRPYGTNRLETLLHFTQSIYLVFASIYVLKESVEHALLEGTDATHEESQIGLVLPALPLLLSLAFAAFSAVVLKNHAKLVAACGISTAASTAQTGGGPRSRRGGHGRTTSVLVDPATLAGPFLSLLSNPFSVTVLFFTLVLTFAAVAMPPFQVAALDKVLAGLESAAMIYVAWPASKALGKVLLQTAPPPHTVQSVQLMRTLKTIEEHPNVTYVAPPLLWQLTPPTSAIAPPNVGPSPLLNSLLTGSVVAQSAVGPAKAASLVANVRIFLRKDCSDADVLDLTRWAWQLAAPALGAGAGLEPGASLRGSLRAGELVVQVSREA